MAADIMKVGARGGGVTVFGQLIKILIQFASVIVLSRLLSPADFGLIAMVTVFVSLGELIRDFGLPMAALQAPKLSKPQASNMFWLNSALGVALGAALICLTPVIVVIYSEQELSAIVPIMAAVLVLNGVQAQVQVQMARSLKFTALATTDIAAQIFSVTVAIFLASGGWGVWALVVQAIVNPAALLILRTIMGRWLPGLPKRRAGTRPLLKSAAHLGFSQILTFGASNADTVIIGARFDATALGFYNRAFQLLTVPLSRTLAPLTRIAVPGINRAREDGHDYHLLLLRVQSAMGMVLVWVFAVAAASAPTVLPFLLGEEWAPSVVIFQLLAVGGCFQVFSYVSYWGFLVAGQSGELLRYNLVTKPLAVVLVLTGSFFGVAGVAAGYALSLMISWPINLLWLRRTAGQPFAPFAANGLRAICAGAVAFCIGSAVVAWLGQYPILAAIACVVTSSATYAAVLMATRAGRREIRQLIRLAKTLLHRGRS